MFLRNDIVEFINKIINVENIPKEEIENNIEEFYKYLKLTKMTDEKTLEVIYKIIDCLPQILILKEKLGTFDINTFLSEDNISKKNTHKPPKEKPAVKVYEEKHYHHYHEHKPSYSRSSSCGGSSNYAAFSGCGGSSSYASSSSCGGSVSRSGC